jgi:hypothetical protein
MLKRFLGIGLILSLFFCNIAWASSTEFTFGSTFVADPSSSADTNVATLDSTHVIVVTPNGATIGTISDNSISFGSVYALPDSALQSSVSVLDSTHAVIAYSDTSTQHKAVVVTISGTSVSYGSVTTLTTVASPHFKYLAVTTLDSTHVAIAYAEEVDHDNPAKVVIGSISGTTITLGSSVQYADDGNYVSIVTIDSTHFILAYGESSAESVRIGSVSGTNITLGSAATNAFGCTDLAITVVDSTHAIMAYCDANASNTPRAVVATISGTSVSLGTPVVIGATTFTYFSLIALDSTHAALAYRDTNNSSYATVMLLTVSGTSVSSGSGVVAIAGNTQFTWMTSPTFGKIILVGKNTSNGSEAEAVIGTIDLPPPLSSSSSSNLSSAPSQSTGGHRGSSTHAIVHALEQHTSHPAAPPSVITTPSTQSTTLQIRTCKRVEGWFSKNQTMLDRVNARLEKRFGFSC